MRRDDLPPDHDDLNGWKCIVLAACIILLGIVLGLAFAASSARAGQVSMSARIIEHDALRGTRTYSTALTRITYAGGLPAQWSLQLPNRQITGTLQSLHYGNASRDHWRADVEYQTWVKGRVFAAGFEP